MIKYKKKKKHDGNKHIISCHKVKSMKKFVKQDESKKAEN